MSERRIVSVIPCSGIGTGHLCGLSRVRVRPEIVTGARCYLCIWSERPARTPRAFAEAATIPVRN